MKKLKLMLCVGFVAMVAVPAVAQVKVVAHRGYWKVGGATGPRDALVSSQNSLRSLVKADSIHCWGSEFDVWTSADGDVFVNHDARINGIEIESSRTTLVETQRLPNGELIPTLDSYLRKFTKHPNLEVVLEVKEHKSMKLEDRCVTEAVRLVKKYGLENRITYITFSLNAMNTLLKALPQGIEVYYLDGELSPATLKRVGAAGLDYELGVMKSHPEWFRQAHELGLKVNVWTVNEEEDMKWCIDQGADFITTNEPELLQRLIRD